MDTWPNVIFDDQRQSKFTNSHIINQLNIAGEVRSAECRVT